MWSDILLVVPPGRGAERTQSAHPTRWQYLTPGTARVLEHSLQMQIYTVLSVYGVRYRLRHYLIEAQKVLSQLRLRASYLRAMLLEHRCRTVSCCCAVHSRRAA